jgi:hypothetical protein
MTHEEATTEAARLSREHPERGRFTWMAREGADGDWEIVRFGLPSRSQKGLRTGLGERPIAPRDDPRPPVPPDQMGGF